MVRKRRATHSRSGRIPSSHTRARADRTLRARMSEIIALRAELRSLAALRSEPDYAPQGLHTRR